MVGPLAEGRERWPGKNLAGSLPSSSGVDGDASLHLLCCAAARSYRHHDCQITVAIGHGRCGFPVKGREPLVREERAEGALPCQPTNVSHLSSESTSLRGHWFSQRGNLTMSEANCSQLPPNTPNRRPRKFFHSTDKVDIAVNRIRNFLSVYMPESKLCS